MTAEEQSLGTTASEALVDLSRNLYAKSHAVNGVRYVMSSVCEVRFFKCDISGTYPDWKPIFTSYGMIKATVKRGRHAIPERSNSI